MCTFADHLYPLGIKETNKSLLRVELNGYSQLHEKVLKTFIRFEAAASSLVDKKE